MALQFWCVTHHGRCCLKEVSGAPEKVLHSLLSCTHPGCGVIKACLRELNLALKKLVLLLSGDGSSILQVFEIRTLTGPGKQMARM